jgi:hypothetical protein
VRVPWVIADTVSVGTDLVWINERAVKFVAEPQNLVSNKDDRVTIGRARVCCGTLRNWNVRFRLIVGGEWRDITVLTGELKESPIRPGTDRVGVVIDFVGTAVSGIRVRDLGTSCARATRTRNDGICRPSTAGAFVSVVAIGTATETTTVLRTTFCYLRND